MRPILAILALSIHLCLAGPLSPVWAAEPLVKLPFAYGAISSNVVPLWTAQDQGFLRKYGLDADLVFIIAGRAAQAMLAGQVAVGLVGATHVTNAVTGGGDLTMILGLENTLDYLFIARPTIKSGEELKGRKVDIGKENIPFQSSGLVTSRKLIKSDPQLIENITKAIVEGVAFIHNPSNKKAVERIIAKYLRLDKPDRVEKAYQDLRKKLPRKPCPTLEGVASVLKLMAQHGINARASQFKPEDVVDMSLCKKLDESGFMDRLYQGW